MGLTLILDANIRSYYCSSTNSVGFKVLLHTPTETPKISNYGFFITPGTEIRAVIDPKINDASQMIRSIPIRQRQCYFASEGNLAYFRTYSKKNCEMECEANLITTECGCVLYYMPKVTEDVRICNQKDLSCYEKIRFAIESQNNKTWSCANCLPGCYEFSFGRELTTSVLGNKNEYLLRDEAVSDLPYEYLKENVAVLHIFFIDTSFRSYTKGILIGFTEFLCESLSAGEVQLIRFVQFQRARAACSACSWASAFCRWWRSCTLSVCVRTRCATASEGRCARRRSRWRRSPRSRE